jgi:hypothetical protein
MSLGQKQDKDKFSAQQNLLVFFIMDENFIKNELRATANAFEG